MNMTETISKTTVGNGVSLEYKIAHCLDTLDVNVSAYEQNGQYVLIDYEIINKDVVSVQFLIPPQPGEMIVEVSKN